jgi:hypothetical protein
VRRSSASTTWAGDESDGVEELTFDLGSKDLAHELSEIIRAGIERQREGGKGLLRREVVREDGKGGGWDRRGGDGSIGHGEEGVNEVSEEEEEGEQDDGCWEEEGDLERPGGGAEG